MRRSLSGGSGGMGGGGGGMLKNVHRAVRASVGGGAAQEPGASQSTTAFKTPGKHSLNKQPPNASNILTLSTAFNVAPPSPFSPAAAGPSRSSSPACSDESEWECLVAREEEEMGNYFLDDYVFGSVPSLDEVHHAFSALQQVFEPTTPHSTKSNAVTSSIKDGAEEVSNQGRMASVPDWMEPSLHICNSRMSMMTYVPNRVYDAFHLMQTEPSIQRMVVSLSSDKAVWDAVLNNEVVRELRDSLKQVNITEQTLPDEESVEPNGAQDIWSWIFNNAKEKVMEIIDKAMAIINILFQQPEREKASEGNTDPVDQQLRTSFFLSILVLLIVVVSRAQNA